MRICVSYSLQLVAVEATVHACACLCVEFSVYTFVCACVFAFVWDNETEPGTEEPEELDYVSQGKGGYLALGHKHSSLSPAKSSWGLSLLVNEKHPRKQNSAQFVTHKNIFLCFLM